MPSDSVIRSMTFVPVSEQRGALVVRFEAEQSAILVDKVFKLIFRAGESIDGMTFVLTTTFGGVPVLVYEKTSKVILGVK